MGVRHRHLDSWLPRELAAPITLPILNVPQLFELLTEHQLFDQDTEGYSHDLHLQYIMECLGPFSPEFLRKCEDRDKYFDKNGEHTSSISVTPVLTSSLRRTSSNER